MKLEKTFTSFILILFLFSSGFSQISMKRIDDGILITDGGKKIALYNKEASAMNLDRGRANFFHPVYLPDGTEITQNAPQDHIHHRGIFWAWHQIMVDGKKVGDQWEMEDFIHDVKSVEFFRLPNDMATMKTIVEWKSPNYKNGQEAFIEEKVTVNFYGQHRNYRIIQFKIQLRAQTDHVALGGSDDVKGYGGFSARIKLPDDVLFNSEDGLVEPQNEAVEAGEFVNISGSLAKKSGQGGMLIYSANDFETANDWILRSKNSMQNAVWPGRELVPISKVTPTVLKYAIVLYTGSIKENRVLKELNRLEW